MRSKSQFESSDFMKSSINIYHYLDYRSFLKDWFLATKKKKKGYSLRVFARQAGLRSPSTVKRVIDGERALTEESLVKFIKAMGIEGQEADYFAHLVRYQQASSQDLKKYYYSKLLKSQNYNLLEAVSHDSYEYYDKWYHPLIREMLILKDFNGDPQWIVDHLLPQLTIKEVQDSIALLEKLGFVKKLGPKKWVQTHPITKSESDIQSLVIQDFHRQILSLSKHLIPLIELDKRDVSSLVLSIDKKKLPELKKRVIDFRKEILKFVTDNNQVDEVVFLNMQLLALSK